MDRNTFAGFWQRVFAGFMDIFVLGFISFFLSIIFLPDSLMVETDFDALMEDPFHDPFLFHPMHLFLSMAYYVGSYISSWQATVGMRMMGIYITNDGGRKISVVRALVRYVAEFLSALAFLLGYLLIVLTPRRQALHDIIAGTTVRRGVR